MSLHDSHHETPLESTRVPIPTRLRNYFLTGVVIAGPLAVTAYLTTWFVSSIDNVVKPLFPQAYLPDTYFKFSIPGFGIIVAFLGLTLLGFFTANLFGRYLVGWSEMLLARTPVISGLYKSVKQIFETVFSQSGQSFRKVGLIEYPAPGMFSIVFISAPPTGAVETAIPLKEETIGVFLPCTPNPTTGFFIYLPRSKVTELPIPVDEAMKLIVSIGVIQPSQNPKTTAIKS
jgi:uncharacterized membrane protein